MAAFPAHPVALQRKDVFVSQIKQHLNAQCSAFLHNHDMLRKKLSKINCSKAL